MRIFAFVTVLGLTAGIVPPLHGQSLADVAKKEGERRKAVQSSKKVYTNGDLTPAPDSQPAEGNTASRAAGASDSSATSEKKADAKADAKTDGKADDKAAAKDAKAADKGDVKDQDYWSTRMRALNEQLDRDRLYAEALQTRVNSLTADFAGRDDPAQRELIAEDREKALGELGRLRKQIEDDKDAIGSAEEEARRAGVPPGWLR